MINIDGFVHPTHPQYQQIIQTSYQGFALETTASYGEAFDEKIQHALEALDSQGFYQFDMTQPAGLGTKVARTFVSRCLVGEPGATYKYLGLRMFAHPWTVGSNAALLQIGELNEIVKATLCSALTSNSSRPVTGSCEYNLTLINRCYPEGDVKLKKEPLFEKDLCSVSWHADSSLEHYSAIGIYHFQRPPHTSTCSAKPWKVALRVLPNAEGPAQGKVVPMAEAWAPVVALPLPQQCLYYMLDDFNHHHQHAVLAGGTHRFASTHRVSLREGHCFEYIQQRCLRILTEVRSCAAASTCYFVLSSPAFQRMSASRKYARKLCLLLQEVEFEWLRQWFIQGELHRSLHTWWAAPMEELQNLFQQATGRLVLLVNVLKVAAIGFNSDGVVQGTMRPGPPGWTSSMGKKLHKHKQEVEIASYEEVSLHLKEVHSKRVGWSSRENDPIYATCAANLRPIPTAEMKCFIGTDMLAKDLGYTASAHNHGHLNFLLDLVDVWKNVFATK